jgi:hypothetical protein
MAVLVHQVVASYYTAAPAEHAGKKPVRAPCLPRRS